MNFLAHAVLAGSSPERIAGSLAGDFVKGVIYDHDYPPEFVVGLRLHRRIDAFSNQNQDLQNSARRLPQSLRRIAPPCIDIIADHFLALAAAENPTLYLPALCTDANSNADLSRYETALHNAIEPHLDLLSSNAQRFFSHARQTQLFSNYKQFDRAARGISYVCNRLSRAEQAPAVIEALSTNMDALRADFASYWPALRGEAERFVFD